MTTGEDFTHPRTVEDAATIGLQLAKEGEYAGYYQALMDMTGSGLAGQIPTPEGLVLKALYHQSREGRGAADMRQDSALKEIAEVYNNELGDQVTPVAIEGLGLLLSRTRRPIEQDLIAGALEAAGRKLRQSGYVEGK